MPRAPAVLRYVPLLLALGIGLWGGCASTIPGVKTYPQKLEGLVKTYERRLADGLEEGLPFRDDGFAYAVDLGNTMRAAVALNNRPLFDRAYGMIREHFLRTGTEDPRARYTVLWRYKPETPPDASGSKETGVLANALWEAYERWGNPEHREMAIKVLKAYLMHGYWESDRRFIVKNYYNYGTQTLSESTWVLHQMPHTVRKIGCGIRDTSLLRRARGMARFVRGAYLKKGFSQEMYDAGIGTVIEGASGYYSPNGIHNLQSSLEIAKAMLPFSAEPAKELVGFLDETYPEIYSHYFYNPRSRALSPLAKTPEKRYTLGERALMLRLATRFRESLGDKFLRDYVGWEIVPELQERKGEMFSTFYFEVPLMLVAAQRYLHSRSSSDPPDESQCMSLSRRPLQVAKSPPGSSTPNGIAAVSLGENPPVENRIIPGELLPSGSLDSLFSVSAGAFSFSPRLDLSTRKWQGWVKQSGGQSSGVESESGPKSEIDPAEGGWTMVVGSLRGRSAADSLRAVYRDRFEEEGFPVTVLPATVDGKTRYRVAVGHFESARRVREALREHLSQLPNDAWPLRLQ